MATLYPSATQTFTDPAGTAKLSNPDHTQRHIDESDTIEAIQTVMGTTSGTSVLKNFAAGDFPVRMNSGGTLQQSISGTIVGASFVAPFDGWVSPNETWTYVSASSFKVSGVNVVSKYPVGTKIKLTQTTVKYFVVTGASFSTDTTITITAGTTYTLANAAITDNYFSYIDTPQGYPQWFDYTPTITANGGGTLTFNLTTARFGVSGRTCTTRIDNSGYVLTGTVSNVDISLPIANPSGTVAGLWQGVSGYSGAGYNLSHTTLNSGAYRVYATNGTVLNWGTTNSGYLGIKFVYEI